jgi:hypothetical protein
VSYQNFTKIFMAAYPRLKEIFDYIFRLLCVSYRILIEFLRSGAYGGSAEDYGEVNMDSRFTL